MNSTNVATSWFVTLLTRINGISRGRKPHLLRRDRRRYHSGSQPLGIYFHDNDAVSLVWVRLFGNEMTIEESETVQLTETDPSKRDQESTTVLVDMIRRLGISERRCVLGIHPDSVSIQPLEVSKGFTYKELQGAAALKAEQMV